MFKGGSSIRGLTRISISASFIGRLWIDVHVELAVKDPCSRNFKDFQLTLIENPLKVVK